MESNQAKKNPTVRDVVERIGQALKGKPKEEKESELDKIKASMELRSLDSILFALKQIQDDIIELKVEISKKKT
jgi:hypothetical protein